MSKFDQTMIKLGHQKKVFSCISENSKLYRDLGAEPQMTSTQTSAEATEDAPHFPVH